MRFYFLSASSRLPGHHSRRRKKGSLCGFGTASREAMPAESILRRLSLRIRIVLRLPGLRAGKYSSAMLTADFRPLYQYFFGHIVGVGFREDCFNHRREIVFRLGISGHVVGFSGAEGLMPDCSFSASWL